jgi:uncharacterized protein (TIGR00369 family)
MEQMIEIYNQINNYGKDNGMKLTLHEPGVVEYRMEITDKHLSSPNTAHGGIIAGLMDSVLGAGALSLAFTQRNLVSTVEFKINYFHPVNHGDVLIGISKVEFQGKSIISTSAEIHCERRNLLVAKGIGTFNAYPVDKAKIKDIFPE